MDRYDLSIEVDRPAEMVWEVASDLSRTPEWRTTIRTIDPPATMAVGSPFSGTTRLLGKSWHWKLQITAFDPPRHFAYQVTEGVATPTVEYLVEPLGDDRARFTMSGHIDQMNLVARMLKPFALRALRRETRVHLQHLKRLVETEV